jgi:hypothetical protein
LINGKNTELKIQRFKEIKIQRFNSGRGGFTPKTFGLEDLMF